MTDSAGQGNGGQFVTGSVVFGDIIQIQGVGGDVIISAERPPYRMEDFPADPVSLSIAQARAQPGRLLLSRYAVVPFTGREQRFRDQLAWLKRPERAAVRLIHGTGGRGKTRLASQLATEAASKGWHVWRALHGTTSASTRLALPAGISGLLVLVDYADRWTASHLIALIRQVHALAERTGVVARVLLVARSAGFWWPAVADSVDSELGIEADAQGLEPLSVEVDRTALFIAARDAFASAMEIGPVDAIRAPVQLGDEGFAEVLAVHMAALVAVDAQFRGVIAPADPPAISAYLLRRERAHWYQLHARAGDILATPPQAMGRAVYVATLGGPLARSHAQAALMCTGITAEKETANQVIDDHRTCYPPRVGDTVLEPLHPDRLGEDFIAMTTPGHPHDSTVTDDWAVAAPGLLLADADAPRVQNTPSLSVVLLEGIGPPPVWVAPAVMVLIETARRWPHIAHGQLYPLLRGNPGLAVAAGGSALARLAEPPLADIEVLEAIEPLLPDHQNVDLDFAAAAIATVLTAHRLARTTDPARRAYLYGTLTIRLRNAGRYAEAVDAGASAVLLYQELAAVNPVKYGADQAGSAINLGGALGEAGRLDEALSAFELAARVAQELVTVDPDKYRNILAMALTSIAAARIRLGHKEQAREAAELAAEIGRKSSRADEDIAHTLQAYGITLANVGQEAEGVAAAEEAVAKWRQLAAANPSAYEAALAGALAALCIQMSNAGRAEDAVAVGEEAVDLLRRLAAVNPAAHEHSYAEALCNLAGALFNAGRREEALATITQASEIQERLASLNPAAYGNDLFDYLSLRGLIRSELGLSVDAMDVTVYRRLAAANAKSFEIYLAMSLHNLSVSCQETGDLQQAVATAEEAVIICRRLLTANFTVFDSRLSAEPLLAQALIQLSSLRIGQEDGLAITSEAVDEIRQLVATATIGQTYLMEALCKFAWARAEIRVDLDEALSAAQEAVTIARGLADQLPEQASEISARANIALADVLEASGRLAEAEKIWDSL